MIHDLLERKRGEKPPFIHYFAKNSFLYFEEFVNKIRVILIFLLVTLFAVSFAFQSIFFQLLFLVIGLVLIFKLHSYKIKLNNWINQNFLIDMELLQFIHDNSLYDETNRDSAIFSYFINTDSLLIIAIKQGNKFDKRIEALDTELQGLFKTALSEKTIKPDSVEYYFNFRSPERLILSSNYQPEFVDNNIINLGYGVTYNPITTPHILVAGGTGSGKSIFITYMLLEFIKRSGIENIYICDPKNSDLGSLSHYLGDEHVASSPNNIARVVRLAVEQMNKRYAEMNEDFKYGSNFVDHGYKPIWVIFDEMGAFQASGIDNPSRQVINEVMDRIKQIILLGRQAGVFILLAAQQMRAETLNTDLRDNLGLRIALGANSSEGYRMVFGSFTPDKIPVIEEKGAGLLYMQGSGKEHAQYWEAPYLDPDKFNFIEELKLYIN